MDIETLRLLHLVARHGGLAPAARVAGMDPSTLSRQVAAAEAQIGARLFERSTRRFAVTEAGARFLDRVAPLIAEFDAARDEAMGARGRVSGVLRMAAPAAFAHLCILPHLATFRRLHPDLVVELLPGDGVPDLAAQNIDLAIRLGPDARGDLVATRLIEIRDRVVASPEWVATHGPVSAPEKLSRHDVLRQALPEFGNIWRFRTAPDGPVQEVAVSGGLVIGAALSLAQVARDGGGPALCPDWLVARDLADGRLVDLFPDHAVTATGWEESAWALCPSRGYLPRKVRAMIEFLRPRLSDAAPKSAS